MNTNRPFDYLPDRRAALRSFAFAAGSGALMTHEVLMGSKPALAADAKVAGDWGTIKGKIVWDESLNIPARDEVDLGKYKLTDTDRDFFSAKGKILSEDWVIDPKSRGIRHVFVWLRPESPKLDAVITSIHPTLADPTAKQVVMDQESLGYNPHAIAMRAGQSLLIKNSSPIAHAIVWNSDSNGSGNVASPAKTEYLLKELKAEKYPIAVSCAPHPWERAWVRVFEHPYFALTDKDGNFEIKLAPGGKHRLVVWQETLGFKDGKAGRLGQAITIEAGATLDLGSLKIKPA